MLSIVVLAGCESTQDKAERLAREGGDAFEERGLRVGERNRAVRVVDTALLRDANGAAAVVVLRSRRAQADVPVAIDVRGAGNRTVFRNDAPGLEQSLVSLPAVPRGRTVAWVNDQVVASDTPRRVRAIVGAARAKAPRRVPRLRTRGVRLERLEATGVAASGFVVNDSKLDQREVVLHGVARRGDRIVAAGRAQVRRVRPGRRTRFRMFFIGDPRRARLSISVPPTRLR